LCRDELLGRDVAVKQVGHLPGESTPDLARAMREARSSAALNHLNVVSIYDAVEEDDHMWLVMEYVPGRSLSEVMAEDGRLPPDRVAWIGAQVADGLAAAHQRGTTHRDVKPGNILVAEGDHAKITDFGIARTTGDEQLTRSGMVTGTPSYFSPELARGGQPSPGDDVWALGATLFTAVEGRPPYPEQSNAMAMLSQIASGRPSRPEHAGPLTEVIGRMMDLDPGSRWSMADAAHALHRVHDQRHVTGTHEHTMAFVPAVAASDPTPEPTPRPMSAPPASQPRRRWPIVAAAAAVVLILAVVVGSSLLSDPDETTSGAGATPSAEGSPSGASPSEGEPEPEPDAVPP